MRSEWRSPQGHTRLHADGCSAPPRPPASHQAVSGRPSLVGGPWVPVARSARACRVQAAAHAVSAAPGREQSRVRRDGSPGWSQLPACGTRTGPPGRHGLSARGPPTHRSTRKHNPQTPTAHPRATPPHRRTPRSHGHTLQGVCASGCARGWSRLGPRARTFEQASYTEPGAPNKPNEGEAGDSLADFLP